MAGLCCARGKYLEAFKSAHTAQSKGEVYGEGENWFKFIKT